MLVARAGLTEHGRERLLHHARGHQVILGGPAPREAVDGADGDVLRAEAPLDGQVLERVHQARAGDDGGARLLRERRAVVDHERRVLLHRAAVPRRDELHDRVERARCANDGQAVLLVAEGKLAERAAGLVLGVPARHTQNRAELGDGVLPPNLLLVGLSLQVGGVRPLEEELRSQSQHAKVVRFQLLDALADVGVHLEGGVEHLLVEVDGIAHVREVRSGLVSKSAHACHAGVSCVDTSF
mmetsp:Transcript_53310/g.121628  ORF Transcript_53310/g.121628 Transcript_53310/m.121628 type:complete len:241 (+) Transcript_53310:805-1527(+)